MAQQRKYRPGDAVVVRRGRSGPDLMFYRACVVKDLGKSLRVRTPRGEVNVVPKTAVVPAPSHEQVKDTAYALLRDLAGRCLRGECPDGPQAFRDWIASSQKVYVLAGASDYEHYPHRLFEDLHELQQRLDREHPHLGEAMAKRFPTREVDGGGDAPQGR
jgi:hypothetical protein